MRAVSAFGFGLGFTISGLGTLASRLRNAPHTEYQLHCLRLRQQRFVIFCPTVCSGPEKRSLDSRRRRHSRIQSSAVPDFQKSRFKIRTLNKLAEFQL
ncbi:hypothetical protein BJX65DRAFT_279323 [Aspergillus insuetus]